MDDERMITLTGIDALRISTALSAIRLYQQTEGRMRLTAMATPTYLRNLASGYTGRRYPRSAQGLEAARVDLQALHDAIDEAMAAERAAPDA